MRERVTFLNWNKSFGRAFLKARLRSFNGVFFFVSFFLCAFFCQRKKRVSFRCVFETIGFSWGYSWEKPFNKRVFPTPFSKNFCQNFLGKAMVCCVSLCSWRCMGYFSLNPQARNEVARSKKSWGYSVGDGKQNDVSPSGDMMFRLRSNDVAPTGRNDVPFVRDKRNFHSVGEGFPLPPIIA